MPRVIVSALDERIVRIAAGGDVGDQIQNLVARELVEQALGHDRRGRFLPLGDVGRS